MRMVRTGTDAGLGGRMEVRGVQAGVFRPELWQSGTLHWVRDEAWPIIEPQPGAFRNIYAPSVVRDGRTWRVFYGAWDGVATGNDRIYSRLTDDFRGFRDRTVLIDHGVFIHTCNCSAIRLPDGSWRMAVTAYPDAKGLNKPALYTSADGVNWDGPAPRSAAMGDLVQMAGDDGFADSDINGMNVLLWDGGKLRMFYSDFKRWGTVWRATQRSGREFAWDGVSLKAPHMVNDVKLFRVGGRKWYLMALHANGDKLWYSLSSDGMAFGSETEMARNHGPEDRYMVAVGWVTDGKSVFGCLFGAGAVPSLDRNRIFARWLQKRVVFVPTGGEAIQSEALGSGLDRVRIGAPAVPTKGRFEVYADDGVTPLYRSPEVTAASGDVWELRAK